MGNFLTAQICENGHIITSDIEKFSYSFCPQCGSKAFDECPSCGKPIHGSYYEYDILFVPEPLDQKPFYCYHCGKPYPWTQKILDSAIELLSLDEDLDSDTKSIIKNAIPNLLVETPETPIATAKYRSAIGKAGQILKDSLYQLLVDCITESAKKVIYSLIFFFSYFNKKHKPWTTIFTACIVVLF